MPTLHRGAEWFAEVLSPQTTTVQDSSRIENKMTVIL